MDFSPARSGSNTSAILAARFSRSFPDARRCLGYERVLILSLPESDFLQFRSKGDSDMTTGYTPGSSVAHNMVTTQFELDGFRVTKTLGVVRGIVVRSRSIFGTIGASLQTIVGGNITLLTNLCEKTRAEAFDLMLQHAAELGGNAVVGARYDATEVMQGVTEVLAYGTAVFVEASK